MLSKGILMSDLSVTETLKDLKGSIQQILQFALAIKSEPKNWFALLEEHKIKPATEEQKQLAAQFNHSEGALPSEVRTVLISLKLKMTPQLKKLNELFDVLEMEELVEFHKSFVEVSMKEYIDSIRPKVTMQSIFANVVATTNLQQQNSQTVNTKTCSCCGAARPGDTDLTACVYCANPFFK